MSIITLHITRWKDYKPRNDLKSMPWFKVSSDIPFDDKMHNLNAAQLWFWVFILSRCAKKMSDTIELNIDWASTISKVSKKDILSMIEILEEKQIVTTTRVSNGFGTGLARVSDEHETCSREEKRREEKKETLAHFSKNERPRFDFEKFYEKYPKKIGKQRAMKIFKTQIDNENQFQQLCLARDRYIEYTKKNFKDPKFIKQCDTFMSSWRDWLDPDVGSTMNLKEKTWLEEMIEKEKASEANGI